MKRPRSAAARATLAEKPPAGIAGVQPWSIGCLWVLLTAMALWRMLLSTGIGGNLSTAVITWRQLEGLLAYVAVGVLLISEPGMIAPVSLGRRRVAGILAGLLALAAVLAGAAQAMLESEMNGSGSNAPEILGFLGDALLALCGLFMAFRELKRILGRIGGKGTSDAPAGLTLLDLWRFAAVQWGLLMVAAIVYLRVRVSPEDAAGNEEIRRLLFFLPAAGALPNAMMAGGIAAWDWIVRRNDLRPAPPRLRAWLVALGAINVGALLLILRPALLALPGAGFVLLAIALYVVGFPAEARRTTGGRIILAAWALMAIAIAGAMLDRILEARNIGVSTFYGAAWRHLWGTGAIALWLIGAGFWLVEREPVGRGIRRAVQVAAFFFAAGVVITGAIFLVTCAQAIPDQGGVLRWLIVGAIPEVVGLLAAGAVLLRVFASLKKSPPARG